MAVFRIACSTSSLVAPGLAAYANPAMPATSGADADVPQNDPQPPLRFVVQTQPGAASRTHEPRVDQLYSVSLLVVAATLITPEYAAG